MKKNKHRTTVGGRYRTAEKKSKTIDGIVSSQVAEAEDFWVAGINGSPRSAIHHCPTTFTKQFLETIGRFGLFLCSFEPK